MNFIFTTKYIEVFVHKIIKFETFTDMCTCSKNLWPKHFQNSTKSNLYKQHLEALALVDASYKVDSHKKWS